MRSSTYGIHPICASAYNSRSSGKRTSTPENRKSINDNALLANMFVACTASGASGDELIVLVPEPMCIATAVPVSAHAAKNGSQ